MPTSASQPTNQLSILISCWWCKTTTATTFQANIRVSKRVKWKKTNACCFFVAEKRNNKIEKGQYKRIVYIRLFHPFSIGNHIKIHETKFDPKNLVSTQAKVLFGVFTSHLLLRLFSNYLNILKCKNDFFFLFTFANTERTQFLSIYINWNVLHAQRFTKYVYFIQFYFMNFTFTTI